ncbi:unnamed protein product [marine sediment metagenome]|uniref:Uncharacterized protein n=1 Tax=marine sediment metagenome TaxID=412755 RepID=X0WTA2_9ZZZZ
MSTTPPHSPLPWKRGTDGLIFDANNDYVTDTCGTSLPGGEANQVLIVNAVNSHESLLKVCNRLYHSQYGECSKEDEEDQIINLRVSFSCVAALTDAIAKAEGKPKL